MRYIAIFAISIAGLGSVASESASAQPAEVENAADPYVHKAAGVRFPKKAGSFSRGRITEFDQAGSNVSVGYQLDGMAGDITLYLYPTGGDSCDQAFAGADAAIVQRGGTEMDFPEGLNMPGFALARQKSSAYNVARDGFGFSHEPLVSYLWIGCVPGGEWLVKYRGSFFKSDESKVAGLAEDLFARIDWRPLAPSK